MSLVKIEILTAIVIFAFGLLAAFNAEAAERDWQQTWCNAANGETEHQLEDRTRVDCLTDRYAIEFDFAHKWAEAIGQSLHYSALTGKQAAIILITQQQTDCRYYERLRHVIQWHGLDIVIGSLPVECE